MSMRPRVGRQEIEQFLIQVGRTRQPGRLYLTGGAALVHQGIRPGQTLDSIFRSLLIRQTLLVRLRN